MKHETKPLARDEERPLVTFALFAYNQEQFIREAVEGAFGQTYSPLEIILSDDCSQDKTFDIIKEMVDSYKGPHKLVLNRNEKNLGLAGHVNKIIQICEGEIVILAAGDDISMPERAEKSWKLLSENEDCTCISFSTVLFQDGNLVNSLKPQNSCAYSKHSISELIRDCDFHINGAARSFRRSVFKRFGLLNPATPTEDSTILLRCLLSGPVLQSKERQVYYRIHGGNYYASNSKYSINYKKIHDQYMGDLNEALGLRLVTEEKYQAIKTSLKKRLKKRKLRFGFYNSEHRIKYFLTSMLFSSKFRIKEKLRFMKKSFSNKAL